MSRIKKIVALVVVGVVIVSLVIAGCAAPTPTPTPTPSPPPGEEVFELTFAAWAGRGTWTGDTYWPHWAELIEDMSGGRIKIDYSYVGEVFAFEDAYPALTTGALDLGTGYTAYNLGLIPEGTLTGGLPFSLPEVENQIILWEVKGWNEIWEEVQAAHNVKFLSNDYYSNTILASKYPITSLDDLKGLKVHAYGVYGTFVELLGMKAVYIDRTERYLAAATGVIDAQISGALHEHEELKMEEVTPYIMMPAVTSLFHDQLSMNMDTWNSLPEDLHEVWSGPTGRCAATPGG